MKAASNFLHTGLSGFNLDKIAGTVSDVSNAVSSISGVINNGRSKQSHYAQLPASNYGQNQNSNSQGNENDSPAWLLPAAIGGGIFGILGITLALTN